MFDLSKSWIEYPCEKCGYKTDLQLIDAKSEKVIFCHNCKVSIQLIDSEGSVHNGIKKVSKDLENLKNLFK